MHSEYRALSREWHAFLGFRTYLGRRDTKLQVSAVSGETIIRPICSTKCSRGGSQGVGSVGSSRQPGIGAGDSKDEDNGSSSSSSGGGGGGGGGGGSSQLVETEAQV